MSEQTKQGVYLRVFPLITVLADSEEEAAAKIDAMEEALIAVNPSVLKGDLFEEVWIMTEANGVEDERTWERPVASFLASQPPEQED